MLDLYRASWHGVLHHVLSKELGTEPYLKLLGSLQVVLNYSQNLLILDQQF